MRWAVLLVTVSLVSCGPSNSEVEVADVNARDALDQVSSLRSRVDELERENAALKARLDYIEAEIS